MLHHFSDNHNSSSDLLQSYRKIIKTNTYQQNEINFPILEKEKHKYLALAGD